MARPAPTRGGAVLAVSDFAAYEALAAEGVRFLAEPYEATWGDRRFFCVDPDS